MFRFQPKSKPQKTSDHKMKEKNVKKRFKKKAFYLNNDYATQKILTTLPFKKKKVGKTFSKLFRLTHSIIKYENEKVRGGGGKEKEKIAENWRSNAVTWFSALSEKIINSPVEKISSLYRGERGTRRGGGKWGGGMKGFVKIEDRVNCGLMKIKGAFGFRPKRVRRENFAKFKAAKFPAKTVLRYVIINLCTVIVIPVCSLFISPLSLF